MNTEHDWQSWWDDDGSSMRPLNGQSHESHVRDMTRIAWLNAAFGAADEIERLRAERDEARREWCIQSIQAQKGNRAPVDVLARKLAEDIRGWDCFRTEAKP